MVVNPDVLLGNLPGDSKYYTVLDLKDAFFCISLDLESQELFTFEWEDPETHQKPQYYWTVLPQDLKIPQPLLEKSGAKT